MAAKKNLRLVTPRGYEIDVTVAVTMHLDIALSDLGRAGVKVVGLKDDVTPDKVSEVSPENREYIMVSPNGQYRRAVRVAADGEVVGSVVGQGQKMADLQREGYTFTRIVETDDGPSPIANLRLTPADHLANRIAALERRMDALEGGK